jgi:hypothetical protein
MIILNKLATSNFIPKHNEKYCAYAYTKVWEQKCFRLRYNMPITYEGINAEHETVTAVGVFDVAHGNFYLQVPMHWL